MKVVILCGGKGTRLREETEYKPKPMVDVGGKPIIWHIIKHFLHYNFKEFILCLGYKGNVIKEYFLKYNILSNNIRIDFENKPIITCIDNTDYFNASIIFADTGLDTHTAGRISKIRSYINDDEFIVTYGDGLSNININQLLDYHYFHGKVATVTAVKPYSRYGMLDIDENFIVTSFKEKPQIDGWVSCGYFVFNKSFLDVITDKDTPLEGEPLNILVQNKQLVAYKHTGFFYSMDTYREYLQLNDWWNSGNALWKIW